MQVISLLGMKLAVAESRVCLIRCKSPKELGQEDKSPLLSLLQQQLVSLRYFKRGGRCNGCGMGCALEALQAFLSYSLESASTEGGGHQLAADAELNDSAAESAALLALDVLSSTHNYMNIEFRSLRTLGSWRGTYSLG
ncbi:uncharacterized protein FFB20_14535 [Fusarium fujikuroi]|uniref:Uncharacterized protein n=2 Tax=Fusarium fujikuroi TaxID=5127 RepID=S0E1H0_GIBF5|nr:uncharacterized protein FFUJ_07401 [Fusarium fujikuroi IMI 58289]SCN78469.1 uncharacterized protein FFC1_02958 [Fusarium fujikuroi]CCT68601.1 uncharacterized protein FFUJ_07401 [Fusarium fujikuroi IMI 58289]SCN85688.1 uncharacterized protein FFE2_05754 [Fusarium fujikuroi]SCN91924.1 uncharacterized protein FFM5_05200 [Fusarium fujikuroi]SCO14541.1 uncharacterized protein FFB20_14535 [Fusarium fujikuroi]